MKVIDYLRVHFPALAAGVVTVLTILQQTGALVISAKWYAAIVAIALAFGVGVVHVRQQAALQLKK